MPRKSGQKTTTKLDHKRLSTWLDLDRTLHRIINFFAYLKTVWFVTLSKHFYTTVNPIKYEIVAIARSRWSPGSPTYTSILKPFMVLFVCDCWLNRKKYISGWKPKVSIFSECCGLLHRGNIVLCWNLNPSISESDLVWKFGWSCL